MSNKQQKTMNGKTNMHDNNFIKIISGGDITNANEQIIIHQCNCISKGAKGLSKIIFNKWNESNIYAKRKTNSNTGTIDITNIIEENKFIIGVFAQKYPGKSNKTDDTKSMRILWMCNCLEQIGNYINEINNNKNNNTINSVAMPYFIGCGLAGGDWDIYLKIINEWAQNYGIYVSLYDINDFHDNYYARP